LQKTCFLGSSSRRPCRGERVLRSSYSTWQTPRAMVSSSTTVKRYVRQSQAYCFRGTFYKLPLPRHWFWVNADALTTSLQMCLNASTSSFNYNDNCMNRGRLADGQVPWRGPQGAGPPYSVGNAVPQMRCEGKSKPGLIMSPMQSKPDASINQSIIKLSRASLFYPINSIKMTPMPSLVLIT
jgi:hypothetical protein